MLSSFSTKEEVRAGGRVDVVSIFDEVEVILVSFLEEVVEAVSNVFVTVVVLATLELEVGLESKGNSVSGFCEFDEG